MDTVHRHCDSIAVVEVRMCYTCGLSERQPGSSRVEHGTNEPFYISTQGSS